MSVLPRLTRVITGYAVQLLCRKTQNVRRKAIRNNQLIGKETERGWEQAEDVSTLLPSLVHYPDKSGEVVKTLRQCLNQMSLTSLQKETGLSRHTILRAPGEAGAPEIASALAGRSWVFSRPGPLAKRC